MQRRDWSTALVTDNNKLSCRREVVRCFVSLNISLRHSRSLNVTQRHSKWHPSVGRVSVPISIRLKLYVFIAYRLWDTQRQIMADLEIWLRSHSRSMEMTFFYRLRTSSCWRFIITMILYCIIFEIKRRIGRISRLFIHPVAFGAIITGCPSEYYRMVW